MDAIFNGISAVAECFIGLIKLFFGGFVNLAKATRSDLSPAARQKAAMVALAQICTTVFAVIVIVGLIYFLDQPNRNSRMQRATMDTVTRCADRLDQQIENGRYTPAASPLPETDAWGRALTVQYKDETWGQSLTVFSAGLDGQFGTRDDIDEMRNCISGRHVAKQAARRAGEAIKKKLKPLARQPSGNVDNAPAAHPDH